MEVFVVGILVAQVGLSGFLFLKGVGFVPFLKPIRDAIAQEEVQDLPASEPSSSDFQLLVSLKKREEELARRAEEIQREEQRLTLLKQELEHKIETLTGIQDKVETLLSAKEGEERKRIVQLAKVYESTPAEQAGPMLGKMDVKVAAQILLNMNGRKAGKIWGFVDPEKAVTISEELAKMK
jgi:flagellar motility protein MotE (MotC chaperone)